MLEPLQKSKKNIIFFSNLFKFNNSRFILKFLVLFLTTEVKIIKVKKIDKEIKIYLLNISFLQF